MCCFWSSDLKRSSYDFKGIFFYLFKKAFESEGYLLWFCHSCLPILSQIRNLWLQMLYKDFTDVTCSSVCSSPSWDTLKALAVNGRLYHVWSGHLNCVGNQFLLWLLTIPLNAQDGMNMRRTSELDAELIRGFCGAGKCCNELGTGKEMTLKWSGSWTRWSLRVYSN